MIVLYMLSPLSNVKHSRPNNSIIPRWIMCPPVNLINAHRLWQRKRRRREKFGICYSPHVLQIIIHGLHKTHGKVLIPHECWFGPSLYFYIHNITQKGTRKKSFLARKISELISILSKELPKWKILPQCISQIKQPQHIQAVHFHTIFVKLLPTWNITHFSSCTT